jgi:hypothetical protein
VEFARGGPFRGSPGGGAGGGVARAARRLSTVDGVATAEPTPPSPKPAAPPKGVFEWLRAHLVLLVSAIGVVLLIIIVIVVASLASSGGGGTKIVPGSLVGTGPLTSGYRLTGTVKKRTATTISVDITSVNYAAPEARNVDLRPGVTLVFDQPAQGIVLMARNQKRITGAMGLHVGDTIVLVGQFTSVQGPPGQQGYAFFAFEATSGK